MSLEEKKHLKEELESLKVEDISSFMESLPPDFLTVFRTDWLLRSLMRKLGAPERLRLLSYAKCALCGISTEASSESEIMELVAYMDEIRRSLVAKLRRVILSVEDRIRNLRPVIL